jgi:uncharacterized protein (DUF2147 family)
MTRPKLATTSQKAAAKKAKQAWNGGKVGTPATPKDTPTPGQCAKTGCGDLSFAARSDLGLVRIEVDGSREPARWYCPGPCAGYGQALAEIRAIPTAANE